jgi:hypothetical protein
LSGASIELTWRRFISLGSSAASPTTDADVEAWISVLRLLLRGIGGSFYSVQETLPSFVAARVTAMIVALRLIAHLPSNTTSETIVVLNAVHRAFTGLVSELQDGDGTLLLSAAFPLRLMVRAGIAMTQSKAPPSQHQPFLSVPPFEGGSLRAPHERAAATPVSPWPRVLEDVLRWSLPEGGSEDGSSEAAAGTGALGMERDVGERIEARPGLPTDAVYTGAIVATLLDAPVPEATLSALGSADAAHLVRIARGLAPHVRCDLLALLFPSDTAPVFARDVFLRACDAVLRSSVRDTEVAVAYAPPLFTAIALEVRGTPLATAGANQAGAAGVAGGGPRGIAQLRFPNDAAASAAGMLYSALYESVTRYRSDAFTTVEGLAAAFLDAVDRGGTSSLHPAMCIWSTVLMVRMLEVRLCSRSSAAPSSLCICVAFASIICHFADCRYGVECYSLSRRDARAGYSASMR